MFYAFICGQSKQAAAAKEAGDEIPVHSDKGSPLDTQYLGAIVTNEALSQRWHPSQPQGREIRLTVSEGRGNSNIQPLSKGGTHRKKGISLMVLY